MADLIGVFCKIQNKVHSQDEKLEYADLVTGLPVSHPSIWIAVILNNHDISGKSEGFEDSRLY